MLNVRQRAITTARQKSGNTTKGWKGEGMITLAKMGNRISDDGKSWITISRTVQEADLKIFKAKEDKRNKQMLWKSGARRFK